MRYKKPHDHCGRLPEFWSDFNQPRLALPGSCNAVQKVDFIEQAIDRPSANCWMAGSSFGSINTR